MPTGRSRSYDSRANETGYYTNVPLKTTVTSSVLTGSMGTCVDVIGNPTGVNALDLTKQKRWFPSISGTYLDPVTHNVTKIMSSFPLGWQNGSPDPRTAFPALTGLQKSNLAWELLSKANPSAPSVSVPTVIGELKDIPSMMKRWYGLFFKPTWRPPKFDVRRPLADDWHTSRPWAEILSKAPSIIASGHLTWRWAIAPFIRDLRNIIFFQQAMAKRLKMLNDLCSGSHTIRRRVQLRTDAKMTVTRRLVHSQGAFIYGYLRDSFTEKVWGTVRYQALDNTRIASVRFMDDKAKSEYAFRLTLGLTSFEAVATAWELMPWSWLIDWFTGFGTVLSAQNNTLGLIQSHASLMRHTRCVTTMDVDSAASDKWVGLNKPYYTDYERKERFPATPALPFAPTYLPLLTRKAGLILGSLFVLKVSAGNSLERNLRLLVADRNFRRLRKRK